jgi:DNA-binding transcriptional regulator LsrR (DeoR family)
MARTIDEHHVQELLAQGRSERAIAKELQVPRSTLKRYLERLQGIQNVHLSIPPSERTPTVHTSTLYEPTPSPDELADLLTWWRERKQLMQTSHDPEHETERKTYHVEKRYIAAIERDADLERVSITEIVNRAFRHYFAGKKI